MNIKASINEKIQSVSNTSLIRIINDIFRILNDKYYFVL